MASWFVRGRILGRQAGTLNGRLRSLSSSLSSNGEQINNSSLRVETKTEDSDEIESLASYVTKRLDEFTKFGEPPLPLAYAAEFLLNEQMPQQKESERFTALLLVDDLIRNFPEVDAIQLYHADIFYRSILFPDCDPAYVDPCKESIICRVLNIIQGYPKVGDYKVKEETHFVEDLGFGKWDCIEVLQALQVVFKIYIPDEIVSCKLAIEYISDHIKERLSVEEFQKHLYLTGEFGESKSEFRKLFVPNGKTSSYYTKLEPLHNGKVFSWKGLKLHQFFRRMKDTTYLVEASGY